MSQEITGIERNALGALAHLTPLIDQAQTFTSQAKARNTIKGYDNDWRHFTRWCAAQGLVSLPASSGTVALYLTDLAQTHKASTLTRRLSAISQSHQAAGHDSPTHSSQVRLLMQGIRRTLGTAPETKAPLLADDIRRIGANIPDTLLGKRDRALLLLGFAMAARRSELVGLDVTDLAEDRRGLVVTIRRSKTDQEGAGEKLGVPYSAEAALCPVLAVRAWLAASRITEGPIFRTVDRHGRILPARLSGEAVLLVVRKYAEQLGLDPQRFGGHSLRSGLATSAAIAGKSERSIMAQTRHRSTGMVRRYIRDGSLFRENAMSGLLD